MLGQIKNSTLEMLNLLKTPEQKEESKDAPAENIPAHLKEDFIKEQIDNYRFFVPSHFICPISKDIMYYPVVAADGFTYNAEDLMEWLSNNSTSPLSREIVTPPFVLSFDYDLYQQISNFFTQLKICDHEILQKAENAKALYYFNEREKSFQNPSIQELIDLKKTIYAEKKVEINLLGFEKISSVHEEKAQIDNAQVFIDIPLEESPPRQQHNPPNHVSSIFYRAACYATFAAVNLATDTLINGLGAGILTLAGHPGHNILESMATAAVGSAIWMPVKLMMPVKLIMTHSDHDQTESTTISEAAGQAIFLTFGMPAFIYNVIGHPVLKTLNVFPSIESASHFEQDAGVGYLAAIPLLACKLLRWMNQPENSAPIPQAAPARQNGLSLT